MNHTTAGTRVAQLPMPGIPAPAYGHSIVNFRDIAPGQEVLYLGRLSGGPRQGVRGVVKQTLLKKAVVDMGRFGTWNIPYCFLVSPQAA
jgi:hypothetical protein